MFLNRYVHLARKAMVASFVVVTFFAPLRAQPVNSPSISVEGVCLNETRQSVLARIGKRFYSVSGPGLTFEQDLVTSVTGSSAVFHGNDLKQGLLEEECVAQLGTPSENLTSDNGSALDGDRLLAYIEVDKVLGVYLTKKENGWTVYRYLLTSPQMWNKNLASLIKHQTD